MALTDLLVPVIGGAFIIGFGAVLLYLIYYLMKIVGVFKVFKRKVKIPDDIYNFVIGKINENKETALADISEHFSKFPRKTQNLYIQAYLEVKDEMKQ